MKLLLALLSQSVVEMNFKIWRDVSQMWHTTSYVLIRSAIFLPSASTYIQISCSGRRIPIVCVFRIEKVRERDNLSSESQG